MKDIPYISAVGSIMYLAMMTRPDIAETASVLAHYNSNPGALLDFSLPPSPATSYTSPSPNPLCAFPLLCTSLLPSLSVEPPAPDMVLSSSGPPSPKRPKSSIAPTPSASLPSHPTSTSVQIFSPAPSKPSTSWFNLLASPAPSPVPQMPPAAIVTATPLPAPRHDAAISQPTVTLESNLMDNHLLVTNISSDAHSSTGTNLSKDPWAHAHARVCMHANQECAACSISLTCCSCCSLRYTPGPPPSFPALVSPHVTCSRSASPVLFCNVGNGSPPRSF